MTTQQIILAYVCLLLAWQQIGAVVNKAKNSTDNAIITQQNETKNETNTSTDAKAAASEPEADRREAPLTDSYGAPLPVGLDTYVPSGPSLNSNLPIPVYGVPNAPSNNFVYPAPPPDIPPPLPSIPNIYGPPVANIPLPSIPLIQDNYGPPPPLPPSAYGPPIIQKPPKHFINQPFHSKPFKTYGPPRPQKPFFIPKPSKPFPNKHKPVFISHKPNRPISFPNKEYGPPLQLPPLPQYGLPELPQKPALQYGPPQLIQPIQPIYGPPPPVYGLPHKPALQYGPPETVLIPHGPPHGPPHKPTHQYGPPEPVPHGPPHPGVPAPPTPPDIKYDGWHPIPGLVSRPPSDTYGLPHGQPHGAEDLRHNIDFSPPPPPQLSSHSVSINSQGVSDSYGAPLNAVTGSGGVASSSVDHHAHNQQSDISLIKSVGLELLPSGVSDTYGAPPPSSYAPDGPYAAALGPIKTEHNQLQHQQQQHQHHHQQHQQQQHHHLQSSGIGLIPPSGVYGAPPSGQYGTPLIGQAPPLLNALDINQPKHPIKFREPVPPGLLESIGKHTAHKDAHGIIDSHHASGPVYLPPPVPEVGKGSQQDLHPPPQPSSLYSLPNVSPPISFQNLAHGSATAGLGADISTIGLGSHSYNLGEQVLTSYTAPLGSVDGSYGLPSGSAVGLDFSHPPVTIDLTNALNTKPQHVGGGIPTGGGYPPHDCSHNKPQLPALIYGVPSASGYTASLSSLTTNLGTPHLTYGTSDLHAAHSQAETSINTIEDPQGKSYGKSLAASFGEDSELIKSQSIDFNNIPVQGELGSYTLQIQSANGAGGSTIPHGQVLNDGLLQSILQAIEQPQNNGATILGQPLVHFQTTGFQHQDPVLDTEPQHSVKSAIVVPSPPKDQVSTATTQKNVTETESPLQLIEDNEIALYFSNKNTTDAGSVQNGQQYGTYVSFKGPSNEYAYGDMSKEAINDDKI